MTRKGLEIEDGGFPVYPSSGSGVPKAIAKWNAMRRTASLPEVDTPIIPTKGQVLFTTSEEMHDEPASCYNCQFYNEKAETCGLIGARIKIKKFVNPKEKSENSNPVEYWPCCAMQLYGEPNHSEAVYRASSDPDYLGLLWINAPKPGTDTGGANCGGCSGGDDCDNYLTDGTKAKWDTPTGFCRALQTTVACGDVCTMWDDDDKLDWRQAQKILGE